MLRFYQFGKLAVSLQGNSSINLFSYPSPYKWVRSSIQNVSNQACHNNDNQRVPGKERKMADQAFVPFLIRCCFPKA